jgi:KTSC domain-containing protein
MERKKVNSSSIRSVGFDERSRVLEVEFSDGRIIQYSGVSAEIHRRFLSAPSLVSYFRDNIEESFTAKRMKG